MDAKEYSSAGLGSAELSEGSLHSVSESHRIAHWFKSRFAVETNGIQRVSDDERRSNTTHVWNACTFW